MGKCKTVKEALAFLQTHEYAYGAQALLADAGGHSVIINIGAKVFIVSLKMEKPSHLKWQLTTPQKKNKNSSVFSLDLNDYRLA